MSETQIDNSINEEILETQEESEDDDEIVCKLFAKKKLVSWAKTLLYSYLKEIIRAMGRNPEQLLTRDALVEGAITYESQEETENHQLQILSNQLKQLIRKEATV